MTRTAIALTLAAGLVAQPALADEERKRIVKKVRIACDDSGCEEHEHAEGPHAFAWSSSDGPQLFRFRTHLGGGFLGVLLAELTPELRTHFGVAEDAGVMISRVVDDSPAAKAGLRVGDIVTAIDGGRVASGGELAHAVRSRDEGDTLLLEVWRDGKLHNLTATVEKRVRPEHGAMDWAFVVECDDEDAEDCSFARKWMGGSADFELDFDCDAGGGTCDVNVQCDDAGDCVCTMNDEEIDCAELPSLDD